MDFITFASVYDLYCTFVLLYCTSSRTREGRKKKKKLQCMAVAQEIFPHIYNCCTGTLIRQLVI